MADVRICLHQEGMVLSAIVSEEKLKEFNRLMAENPEKWQGRQIACMNQARENLKAREGNKC